MTEVAGRLVAARSLKPLLRWAGGKRWLAESLREVAALVNPSDYIEPFAGGAGVFLGSAWPRAVLGDSNRTLMACYEGLARDAPVVRRKLVRLTVDKSTYQRVATARPRSSTGQAARLLYLNRTAYGGIYRENVTGQYNVPYAGDRGLATILKHNRLEDTGEALRCALLHCGDFEETLEHATPSSLVFCDPPYSLPGGETTFRRYGRQPFDWEDQLRLSRVLQRVVAAGATAIITNAPNEQVQALYPEAEALPLVRRSTLGGSAIESKESVFVAHADPGVAAAVVRTLAGCLLVPRKST